MVALGMPSILTPMSGTLVTSPMFRTAPIVGFWTITTRLAPNSAWIRTVSTGPAARCAGRSARLSTIASKPSSTNRRTAITKTVPIRRSRSLPMFLQSAHKLPANGIANQMQLQSNCTHSLQLQLQIQRKIRNQKPRFARLL